MSKKSETTQIQDEDQLNNILTSFMVNTENLLEFITELDPILRTHDKMAIKKKEDVKDLIRGFPKGIEGKVIDENVEKKIEKVADEIVNFIRAMSIGYGTHVYKTELLYKTTCVMLLSYFDYLFSDLIHFYYRRYPNALIGKDLSISLEELKQCFTKEEAVDFILNKKVESVLFGNLKHQITFFKNDLNIDICEKIINWDFINEAIERRNLIVHNNGVVNRKYMNSIRSFSNTTNPIKLNEGEILSIDNNYYNAIYDEIFLAGLILVQNCWRKWIHENIDEADTSLIFLTEKAATREKWKLAERLGSFSKNIQIQSEDDKNKIMICYCETLRRQNKNEEFKKEFNKLNNIGSPMFLAALCALRDDIEGFYVHVRKIAEAGKISKDVFFDTREWPVFNEFRRVEGYKANIEKAFVTAKKSRGD